MSIKYLNPGYEVDGIFYASKEVRATGIPNKVLRAARDRSRRNIYRDYNNSSAGISREIERRSRPSAKARKKKYDSKRDTLAETRERKYGFTSEHIQQILDSQGGVCAICGETPNPFRLDHDHITGRPRGILCNHCNTGLGFFRDNPRSLLTASRYLDKANVADILINGE